MKGSPASETPADFDLATVDRLLTTTRSVRKRLDLTRPVDLDVIVECIRLATQAPSGGNSQQWRWVVVTDPERRKALAAINAAVWEDTRPLRETRPLSRDDERILDSAQYLYDHMAEVPVHVVPCLLGKVDEKTPPAMVAGFYGSIFPAIWSFQLALRSRGMGSTITGTHLLREAEAASLLGVPDSVTQIALLPVAYYTGQGFRPGSRQPVEEVIYWETWDNHEIPRFESGPASRSR